MQVTGKEQLEENAHGAWQAHALFNGPGQCPKRWAVLKCESMKLQAPA